MTVSPVSCPARLCLVGHFFIFFRLRMQPRTLAWRHKLVFDGKSARRSRSGVGVGPKPPSSCYAGTPRSICVVARAVQAHKTSAAELPCPSYLNSRWSVALLSQPAAKFQAGKIPLGLWLTDDRPHPSVCNRQCSI